MKKEKIKTFKNVSVYSKHRRSLNAKEIKELEKMVTDVKKTLNDNAGFELSPEESIESINDFIKTASTCTKKEQRKFGPIFFAFSVFIAKHIASSHSGYIVKNLKTKEADVFIPFKNTDCFMVFNPLSAIYSAMYDSEFCLNCYLSFIENNVKSNTNKIK
jgi:hypothetical protein